MPGSFCNGFSLTFTGENRRSHSRVEVLNLLALLDYRNHHTLSALRHMDESFAIGLREGYVRSYLDELSPMAQILRAYIQSRRKPAEEHLLIERKVWASSLLKQMPGSLLPTRWPRERPGRFWRSSRLRRGKCWS